VIAVRGRRIDRESALGHARRYLTDRGWAYPAYDGYERSSSRGPLRDADLLAPVLLNVRELPITAYEGLQAVRPLRRLCGI